MSGISFAILLWVLEPLNSSNTSEDLIQLFENKRKLHGIDTYRHISEILRETKSIHKKYFETRPDITDHEQSRRAFKFYGSCYDFIIHMNETPFRKYHLPYTEDDLIAIYKKSKTNSSIKHTDITKGTYRKIVETLFGNYSNLVQEADGTTKDTLLCKRCDNNNVTYELRNQRFLFKPRTKYCDECQKEKEIDSRKSTTTEQLVENYKRYREY